MIIVLDRDGVINYDSKDYIRTPEQWQAIPGSVEAIAQLSQAGHQVVVATNQSGIGRGYYSEETLQAIHHKMQQAIQQCGGELAGIYYCPHHPQDGCECRKPKPGMLLNIAKDFNVPPEDLIFVGDSLCDIQAAIAAGSKPVWVKTGNGAQQYKEHSPRYHCYECYKNLDKFSKIILQEHS